MKKVKVYTTTHCVYCDRAKALLTKLGIPFEVEEVPRSRPELWDQLAQRSGMKTMPQIWADGTLIGGYAELSEMHSLGTLLSLLNSQQ